MAKDPHPPASAPPPEPHPPTPGKPHPPVPAPGPDPAKPGTHVVTFAGQPPVTVTAGSDDEAIAKAKEVLGVVKHEARPDVVKAG